MTLEEIAKIRTIPNPTKLIREDRFISTLPLSPGGGWLRSGRAGYVWGFHPEPPSADAAESPNSRIDAAASIRILGIELSHDSDRRCSDADFAKTALGLRIVSITGNVRHSGKLPNERALTAIHFEGARRRAELYDESIHILSDELIAEPGGHFLARRGTPRQRGAERHEFPEFAFLNVPRPQSPNRNRKAKAIADARNPPP